MTSTARDGETALPAKFRCLLKSFSRVRYIAWRLSGGPSPIVLSLRNGLQLKLRGLQSTDYGVAWDIFWRRCYQSPEPLAAVHRVLDLGANVGFSCLWWCHEYPEATITAFEPHPQHLNSIRWHLAANGLERRVSLIPAAAGTAEGSAWLTDAGSSSTVVTGQTGYPIRVADLFSQSNGNIDLLKIDIEGGEYSLLADSRFPSLGARTLVVEWHDNPGRAWCEDKLNRMGYRTRVGVQDLPRAGLIWAYQRG